VRAATDTEALTGLEPPDHVRRVTLEQLDQVAESFAGIIDAKSPFTFEHSARVAKIARELGTRLGVSDEDKRVLYQGGLLHDVGKLAISNRILDKPGALTPQEFEQMALHPLHSWEIISHVDAFSHLASPASRHHERLDGNGYPWGLGEADLDLATRIITVADVFEAITANRPYRKPMSTKQVLQVLEGGAGSTLDPDVVSTMTGLMDEHLNDPSLGLAIGS
jgi:HD-GYP domain-containing protein (c-di-GMP phosphodiesterase class II)